ncbi:MAG: hypothetical protein RQ875_14110 [Vicingaceae bacterium]|nr:hypothetical protein [Vicingaceae bacterium]
MEYYRLEFSEEQQWLRLDNYTNEANTYGFITIMEKCTDMECHIFEAFLTKTNGETLENSSIKYRNADVLEAKQELDFFLESLRQYELEIVRKDRK